MGEHEPQRWRRLGLVFRPDGEKPWLRSHAQNPIAIPLQGSRCRAIFASRDADKRAHVAALEFDLEDPAGSVELGEAPLLDPGPIGHFDEHGVYPSSIVSHDGRDYLFYIGVNAGTPPPLFYAAIGLAVSDDGGRSFERVRTAPIMDRSEFDPCLVTAPCVVLDGDTWRMWYSSGIKWERKPDGGLSSWYHVKYAESDDGIEWRRDGRVCLDHEHPGERNIARPCILKSGGMYRAWYSFAGDFDYRIGYAESADGYSWTRMDEAVELGPARDWDSQAQAYPWVFENDGRLGMVYSGNEIGRHGFGLAALD